MERFQGIFGIILILAIAFLFSNNKKNINYRLVFSGLGLQLLIGILVLKIPAITHFFQLLGKAMGKIEQFSRQGAAFVYGGVGAMTPTGVNDFVNGGFVFAFNVTATIILVCVLVALFLPFWHHAKNYRSDRKSNEYDHACKWCRSIKQCCKCICWTSRSSSDDTSLFSEHDKK